MNPHEFWLLSKLPPKTFKFNMVKVHPRCTYTKPPNTGCFLLWSVEVFHNQSHLIFDLGRMNIHSVYHVQKHPYLSIFP